MKSESKKKDKEMIESESSSEEESEENDESEDVPGVKIDQIITTPYEKALSIINEAKAFIQSVSKNQQQLIKGLEWVIKVISSHSLYSYELKDEELLNQASEENPDFKQFVEFVNSYNDQFIELNKRARVDPRRGKESFQKSSLNLKSANTNKGSEENKNEDGENNIEKNKPKNNNRNNNNFKKNNKQSHTIELKGKKNIDREKNNTNKIKLRSPKKKESLIKKFKNNFMEKNENAQKYINNNNNIKTTKELSQSTSNKNLNSHKSNSVITKKRTIDLTSPKSKRPQNLKLFGSDIKRKKTDNFSSGKSKNEILESFPIKIDKYSSIKVEKILLKINYNPTKILEKTFNIFELKEIIGQDNVLPIMGKTILDAFGLYSDDIISIKKLDPFLVSISNQYLHSTLYHNSLHGADVTQTTCLFLLNSNAEEVCQSLVMDVLGILIAALGHDLGHPGLTNIYHINASSELALTYNDVSCLENFHASSLFRTIRNPETDIFENMEVPDYKTIRKRMVGNILATDMANHGKIMTVIKSKISLNMIEKKKKFELLSGNEKSKFEEQQSLLDFLIHSADLAHNSKLFSISLKWVELLSEEFWLQGDKEKSMNLPVSFLCDRENYNIPNSQVGFIKGFVIPTYEVLVDAFPTLKYVLINAKINLKKWQNLANKKRLKGWTPEKTKQINYKNRLNLFSSIASYNNIKSIKRRSGFINSLSHELQVKYQDKIDNQNQNQKKSKIIRPIIINKSKNHDKKVHINKIQKIK